MRQWEIGQGEQVGGRSEQQDRFEAFVLDDASTCLLVVADGMGGRPRGGDAAAAVIDSARMVMQNRADRDELDGPSVLRDICMTAHNATQGLTDDPKEGPRATCTAFYAESNEGYWVSVGDSRLYRFRGHELVERTRDQSVVKLLVDMGEITEDEIREHPDRRFVIGSLGGEEPPKLVIGEATIRHGDSIVLCTDGLWDSIEPEEMIETAMAADLDTAANVLAETVAKRAGAKSDNVTVVVGRLKRRDTPWPWG